LGITCDVGRTILALCALVVVGCKGEPKVLEPRSPPPRATPPIALPSQPVPAGYGRVVLHGTDGRLRITARGDTAFVPPGTNVPPTRTGELCVTPCVADLPYGNYRLFMSSADGSYSQTDTDDLSVREGITYHVRAPGKYEPPTWLPVLPTVVLIAASVAVLGGATLASRDEENRTAGFVLIGAGVAVGIGGGLLYYDASRGARQDGATTEWNEPAR
jgi:hypothetical protein